MHRRVDAGRLLTRHSASDHRQTAKDMVRLGRMLKKCTGTGLAWHLQDRVLVYGNKTVVFN